VRITVREPEGLLPHQAAGASNGYRKAGYAVLPDEAGGYFSDGLAFSRRDLVLGHKGKSLDWWAGDRGYAGCDGAQSLFESRPPCHSFAII
jgi:hypothetical protein